MTVCHLEYQRARRALEAFCARRNATASASVSRWRCCQDGNEFLIGEVIGVNSVTSTDRFRALLRFSYENKRWRLFWPSRGGGWKPYSHSPRLETIQAVLEQLEQAPLHVHWG